MIVQYRPITYLKIRVPFQAIFKDSSQNPHPHILILLTFRISSRTIHTITGIIFEYVSNLLIIVVFTSY